MRLLDIKNRTKNLLIFSKSVLRNFEPKVSALDANLKYWLKTGEIIALKKGLYIWRDKYQQLPKDRLLEYIATQLVSPSYLSLEYVMAKYQLLSEPVSVLTLVTSKITREITNTFGVFRYYSMAPKLFTGYQVNYFNGTAPIWEAKKNKAVFDYLYLRFLRSAPVNETAIKELRVNWENLTSREFAEMNSYAALSNRRQIKKVLVMIKNLYYA